MNKSKKKLLLWQLVLTIQMIASITLEVIVIKLNILPSSYVIILLLTLILLLDGMFFFTRPNRERKISGKWQLRKIRPMVGRAFSLMLSVALLVGAGYLNMGNTVVAEVTGQNVQTSVYSLIVLKNSTYANVHSMDHQIVGVNSIDDDDKDDVSLDALTDIITVDTHDYEDAEDLTTALYSGEVDGILVNNSYLTIVEATDKMFEDKTKAIWSYDITKVIESTASDKDVTISPFTMLISGVDTRGVVSEECRSDVNMLVTINPSTRQILMTSIPRDYCVTLANVGKWDKLTHAGLSGTENVANTVEGLLHVKVDFYARVNFQALENIVDALGGIDVYSDQMVYPWGTPSIAIPEGMNHMDGATALAFARERHSYASGDVHRTQNQQDVLKAIIDKLCSTAVLTHYTDLLDAAEGCFQTNMYSDSIRELVSMQLEYGGSWDIQKSTLTGTNIKRLGGYMMPSNAICYMTPDLDNVLLNTQYIQRMLNGEKIDIDEVEKKMERSTGPEPTE